MWTEPELQGLLQGDRSSLEKLVAATLGLSRQQGKKGGLPPSLVEDVCDGVVMTLVANRFEKIRRCSSARAFGSYLRVTVQRAIRDAGRSPWAKRVRLTGNTNFLERAPKPIPRGADELARVREAAGIAVATGAAYLSRLEAAAIRERFVHGKSWAEAARALPLDKQGRPRTAVSARRACERGVRKLRRHASELRRTLRRRGARLVKRRREK